MGRAARPGLGPHARPRGARLARAGARPRRRAGRGQPARRRFARSSSGGRDQRGAWEPVAALLRVLGATAAGEGRALAVAAVEGSVPRGDLRGARLRGRGGPWRSSARRRRRRGRARSRPRRCWRGLLRRRARGRSRTRRPRRTRSRPPGTRGFCSAAAPGRRSFRRQCHGARTTCFGTRGPSTPPRSAAAPAPGCAGAEISDAAGVALEAQKQFEKQPQNQNGTSFGAISLYFSQDIVPSFSVRSAGVFFFFPGGGSARHFFPVLVLLGFSDHFLLF